MLRASAQRHAAAKPTYARLSAWLQSKYRSSRSTGILRQLVACHGELAALWCPTLPQPSLMSADDALTCRLNPRYLLLILALLCFAHALFFAVRYAGQMPLDEHAFRQTQTALTARSMLQDGFTLDYKTPVLGPPWSVPFEFPLYQYLTGQLSRLSGLPLHSSGRLLSFACLALCLLPARSLVRQLQLPPVSLPLFAALLYSSPLYQYWGRSVLIETTALLLTLSSIVFFVDLVRQHRPWRSGVLFVLLMSLAMLQKVTSGLPVLIILAVVYLASLLRDPGLSSQRSVLARRTVQGMLCLGLPLLVAWLWTAHTDAVKSLNPVGVHLTSSNLREWNWGALQQRFSLRLYDEILWKRMLLANVGGVLSLLALLLAWYAPQARRHRWLVIPVCAMGILPILLFPQLHIVHEYYQTSAVLFLLAAFAMALGWLWQNPQWRWKVMAMLVIAVMSNQINFHYGYAQAMYTVHNRENSVSIGVGDMLRESIAPQQMFIAFGKKWSSELPYIAERRALMVPEWFARHDEVAKYPERFTGNEDLGAVLACDPEREPTAATLVRWASSGRHWKVSRIRDCLLATPELAPPAHTALHTVHCTLGLQLTRLPELGPRAIHLHGQLRGPTAAQPEERLYLRAVLENGDTQWLELGRDVPPDGGASSFSRLLVGGLPNGQLSVLRLQGSQLQQCREAPILAPSKQR